MAGKSDYYELLGVERSVDAVALKKAFRKAALECHPDRNPDPAAEERFKAINQAYSVLSDPEQRARYDRYGHEAPGGFGGPFSGRPEDLRDIFGGDVFDQLFGSFFRQSGRRHGRDVQVRYTVSLETVAHGEEHKVTYQRQGVCAGCGGDGCAPGTTARTCETCNGMGQVRVGRGFISMVQNCPECEGQGKVIPSPCPQCRGRGAVTEEVTLEVPIPEGVATGHKLRLDGDGHAGIRGGEAGDLYILIEVEDHPFFERNGDDISCEVPITFPQAALGTSVVVPTLYGKAKVKVPAGTQSSNRLRLKGKGLPKVRGRGKGDQFVRLQIETPVKMSARQKALLEEFQTLSDDAEGRQTQPRQRSFLDKLKEFFE